jgi:hypothetical protein
MAELGQVFDSTAVEPSAPRDTIPPGKYTAQIVRSEMKDTSTGGQMLVLEMEDPRRRVRQQTRLGSPQPGEPNPKAVEIAQQTLSAICRATGQLQVSDSEQLHLKPMTITVAVRPATEKFAASNDIKGYAPLQGSVRTSGYTSGRHGPQHVQRRLTRHRSRQGQWRGRS